jgi:hypothetical protein
MLRMLALAALFIAGTAAAQEAQDAAEPATDEAPAEQAPPAESGGVKTLSGMSILGNEETPTSLVIVPWKSSEIGDGLGVSNSMDDRARPVDKEVFMREIHYWELRSGTEE